MSVAELFNLTGSSAIITGGGTGIGRQMAEALVEVGCSVLLCARDGERCRAVADELSTADRPAIGMRCDVRSESDVATVIERALEAFGRIDILVNNAGAVWVSKPEEMPLSGWQKVVDVNLTGAFLFARAVGPTMIAQGSGSIINVASVAGLKGARPEILDSVVYHATKGGVIAFSRDLACSWGQHGVRVNAIAPGWFPTDMTETLLGMHEQTLIDDVPLGRLGSDQDLKGAVVFLASNASAYVTGHTLVVDGGESAW
jgi:NAD(P)-dependent dehydrogenase (short-subunit alcohol dehydrogenase family)